MPKIKITERDLTGVVQPSQISNTVFVPIKKAVGDTVERPAFALVKSIAMLNEYLKLKIEGSAYPENSTEDLNGDMGYKLCKHLLNVGLDVLVTVVDDAGKIDWDSLSDKGLYDIRFITLGAMDDAEAMGRAKACARVRGDCTALFNLPIGWNYSIENASGGTAGASEMGDEGQPEAYADAPTSVVEKIKSYFDQVGASDGEYCACFAPNFMSINGDLSIKTIDESKSVPAANRIVYAVEEAEVPAAFGYLFAYAASIKNNPEWYAVAGFQRGFIPELADVSYELSTSEMLTLQCRDAAEMYELDTNEDNVGAAINPIANIRPAGYIIYGNRTYRYNDAAKKTTAQSFLNVRNMVSGIKKKLWDASRKFTFEPNNELLWVRFKSFVTPYLDQLQAGNGIIGYKFDRLATTAKARLKCRLVIIPVEAVEDFEIDVTLADDLTVVE